MTLDAAWILGVSSAVPSVVVAAPSALFLLWQAFVKWPSLLHVLHFFPHAGQCFSLASLLFDGFPSFIGPCGVPLHPEHLPSIRPPVSGVLFAFFAPSLGLGVSSFGFPACFLPRPGCFFLMMSPAPPWALIWFSLSNTS